MSKKPDNIVYNEEEGYNAKLLPYATTVGAPVIKLDDVVTWKTTGIQKVNKEIESKFNELKAEYNKLLEEYRWNDLIYNAKFSFEPVIGEVYYMYLDKDDKEFLSLIAPNQWKQKYLATLKLNSDRKWIILDKSEDKEVEI
jgi:Protein of unknown function (DUF2452)